MTELTLTAANFEDEVLRSSVPVMVDFWASWCGPCKMLGPVISEIAGESDGTYKVGKVNVDEEMGIAEKYNIMSIPTVILFKDGQVYKKSVGAVPKAQLLDLLK